MLAGRINSRFGFHKIFWGAIAHSLFTSIHEAYLTKANHGTDELGNSWDDLTQHTKAYHRDVSQGGTPDSLIRLRRKNMRRNKAGERQGLGILTPVQYKLWRRIYGSVYHNYGGQTKAEDNESKALAGQIAWTRLKEMGAQTMWEMLGTRHLQLMRRTDKLLNSVAPGQFDSSSGYKKGDRNQVFMIRRGSLTIGSSVPYANYVGEWRLAWPYEMDEWLDRAVEFGRDVAYERLAQILED